MKPPTSTPASDSALIIWPVREVSNSCLASPQHPAFQNRREHQAHDDEQQPERDGPIARHQRHHALPAGGARVERRDEQQRSNQHELDDGQPEVELLHDDHLVELIGRIEHADEQHRGHAGGHGGHQEQNRQKRAVPQGESLAHAKQAAGVNGDAQAHDEPHAIEPHRYFALHQIKHQHDERDDHEHRQKHHAPGHYRPEVRKQQNKTQRIVEAGGGVKHQQAQADDDHDRRDEAPTRMRRLQSG